MSKQERIDILTKKSLPELREMGKNLGVKSIQKYRKAELAELIADIEKTEPAKKEIAEPKPVVAEVKAAPAPTPPPATPQTPVLRQKPAQEQATREREPQKADYLVALDSGEERGGILDIHPDGYGFLRTDHYLAGPDDVYVSAPQIRRFGLRNGDMIYGNLRIPKETENFRALLLVNSINGDPAHMATRRPHFAKLTPIYPTQRLHLESDQKTMANRLVDLVAPIGLGQRGMIVSPPKAGKTVLLKNIANAILKNHKNVHLIVLLIDERPEEVTDMQRSIAGERADVVFSTFDEHPEHHKKVAEIVLERAKRMVEQGKNLIILMDSITRLARAYNLTLPPGGRTLSGGLDPAALHMPKRFFGAARNIENGGSLTILATALVDTGSKMDDVIFEEFKGTGNMELVLDRRMSERRIFPAIDINKSGTRREDMLLTPKELDALNILRRRMGGMSAQDFNEHVTDMLTKTANNADFVELVGLGKPVH